MSYELLSQAPRLLPAPCRTPKSDFYVVAREAYLAEPLGLIMMDRGPMWLPTQFPYSYPPLLGSKITKHSVYKFRGTFGRYSDGLALDVLQQAISHVSWK
jgi:hypothetical protein